MCATAGALAHAIKVRPAATDNRVVLAFPIGSRMLSVPDERAWAFASGHYYEHNVDTWIGALLSDRPGAVFYDVGSNIGYYALRAAACGARRVHAFEPVQSSYAVMRANVDGAGQGAISAWRLGLAAASGRRAIQLYSSSGSNSLFGRRLHAGHPHRHVGEEEIDLTTLDDFVAGGVEPPDVVKLDIEGGELDALRGAERLLAERRPVLIMEVSAEICGYAGHQPSDVYDLLAGHGYALWGLSQRSGDLRAHRLPEEGIENIVAVPVGTALPGPGALRTAQAARPALTALQRYQAVFARRHRVPRAAAAARACTSRPEGDLLAELAMRRGHIDFVACPAGADGDLVAALRPHVRGVVALETDARGRELVARRFAADPGVRVGGEEDLSALLADAPRPPLVWLGDVAQRAGERLRELAAFHLPSGTTLVVAESDDAWLAACEAFPGAARSRRGGALVLET